MSFIGKKTIFLSKTVSVQQHKNFIILKSRFGILKIEINLAMLLIFMDSSLSLKPKADNWKKSFKFKSMWGTLRNQIQQTLTGVFKSHFLKLKFVGVGYKAFLKRNILILRLGFSHKIFMTLPDVVKMKKIKKRPPTFVLTSHDYSILRATAFLLRSFKNLKFIKGKVFYF